MTCHISRCRAVRRELDLVRHVCLAFMVIGDDGLDHRKLSKGDYSGEKEFP